ncbi:MAG: glutamine--tRNA ligase/YqeY domain fusion protein [Candidatus Omnitrophica bacterium]|nr:glutamine--tRNA ligase/YqeY domain fusion protein [Candidatus Omnitrophota bacterium]
MDHAQENRSSKEKKSVDFIRTIVAEDIKKQKNNGEVVTRFPPEPNGYLHIGHAKSICLNFGIAQEFNGTCHLRFDDTNPTKEEVQYVESIKEDVLWLGFNWADKEFYASDYFERLCQFAVQLIKIGKAYVDSSTPEEIRASRGTLTEPGQNSPYRDRPIKENLELFEQMRKGDMDEGQCVLRAKIDLASSNINMRDPVIYRILKAHHHRTKDQWCIYPMYDFTHGLSDSIEGITHSLCTLEFENHRPLYDWFLEALQVPCHPQQIEFARLNLTYTVMSKRKLLELVRHGHVSGWDDPRMPTISGLRRRGYPPEAIREFCDRIGIAKVENLIDISLLEFCVREDLNKHANRVMVVLDPLKLVITNYPVNQTEDLEAINNPEDESAGTRLIPFGRELYIERSDFMEDPPKKFFRLAPGKEVRLRYAYFITCEKVIKNDQGGILEVHCRYDPASKGGQSPDGRKVKGTLHWVAGQSAVTCEVRLYDRLFFKENPDSPKDETDYKAYLNPDSLKVEKAAFAEPCLASAKVGDRLQFERLGYFCVDPDSNKDKRVVNRTVALKDSWAKMKKI